MIKLEMISEEGNEVSALPSEMSLDYFFEILEKGKKEINIKDWGGYEDICISNVSAEWTKEDNDIRDGGISFVLYGDTSYYEPYDEDMHDNDIMDEVRSQYEEYLDENGGDGYYFYDSFNSHMDGFGFENWRIPKGGGLDELYRSVDDSFKTWFELVADNEKDEARLNEVARAIIDEYDIPKY